MTKIERSVKRCKARAAYLLTQIQVYLETECTEAICLVMTVHAQELLLVLAELDFCKYGPRDRR